MRVPLALAALVAGVALADVPGPKTVCRAPPECVPCSVGDRACIDVAVDAGLILSDCVSRVGTPTSFLCPPGVMPTAACSCSSAGGGLVLGGRRRLSHR
ncbi:MAG: hypothetical protein JNM69_20830 [Archangium sp.]|nr:hypothetical protein [Archangium sp.]